MSEIHALLGDGELHRWHDRAFADKTAREAYAYVLTDVGKVYKQNDDNSFHVLLTHSPKTFKTLNKFQDLTDVDKTNLADLRIPQYDNASGKFKFIDLPAGGISEWSEISGTLSQGSHSSPLFSIQIGGDITTSAKLRKGMRVRIKENAGSYQKFFLNDFDYNVTAAGKTTLFCFGGTSASQGSITSGTLSNLALSIFWNPEGFDLAVENWRIELENFSFLTTSSIPAETWTALASGAFTISVPRGDWSVRCDTAPRETLPNNSYFTLCTDSAAINRFNDIMIPHEPATNKYEAVQIKGDISLPNTTNIYLCFWNLQLSTVYLRGDFENPSRMFFTSRWV